MIRESAGEITDRICAIGIAELPGYLIAAGRPTLIESGMIFMGPRYLANLKERLGDEKRLRFNFLTHSHYDHAGSSPYLKKKIPGLKLGAHRIAAEIFEKPSAIELIRSLTRNEERRLDPASMDEDLIFTNPRIDLPLEDGAEIELGDGLTLRAMATPGHTRDSMSYFIPELKALFPGEAAGGLNRRMHIQSEFTSSYRDFMNSLERLATLDCRTLMLGHTHTLTDEDARAYIRRSLRETKEYRDRIMEYLNDSHGDREAVVQRIYREEYVEAKLILQALQPYMINLISKVKVVAEGR